MRTILSFAAVALTAAVFVAPQASADNWINLFDNETLFGWTPYGDVGWAVEDGNMVSGQGSGGWISTTSQYGDFQLTAQVKVAAGWSTALLVRAGCDGSPYENGTTVIELSEPEKTKPDWRNVVINAQGGTVTATVDGQAVEVKQGNRPVGFIGLAYHRNDRPRGGEVQLASMRLQPINMKPLFNGTDLTGWNIIPGHKSKFAVVDGAINITNGNGQIETAGTYKNFILQLDIISNGEHLNSGVFYRGPVGVFWKGYESQVRNQWVGDDRAKPVDFGTGGNYGNQPARKVVSSDGEWFTKTIVANGNHTSVFIDGYLASDYLDVRPISESSNGKEGYVPGPGTIHLQGHDPTTDLSFKNIVIQEYPDGK